MRGRCERYAAVIAEILSLMSAAGTDLPLNLTQRVVRSESQSGE
jgi:hypothetical protein